jgi:hypothetical protein
MNFYLSNQTNSNNIWQLSWFPFQSSWNGIELTNITVNLV